MSYTPKLFGAELPRTNRGRRYDSPWEDAVKLAGNNPGIWVTASEDSSISVVYHLRNGKIPATRDLDRTQWEFAYRRDDAVHKPNRGAIYMRKKVNGA